MNLQSALLTTALLQSLLFRGGARRGQSSAAVPKQELEAKIAYCKTCHGLSGQGLSWIVSDAAAGRTATGVS